jgi:hypothetical protein
MTLNSYPVLYGLEVGTVKFTYPDVNVVKSLKAAIELPSCK